MKQKANRKYADGVITLCAKTFEYRHVASLGTCVLFLGTIKKYFRRVWF